MIEDAIESVFDGLGEAAYSLIAGAFTGQASRITDAEWSIAAAFTNKTVAVMSIFTIALGLFQLGKVLLAGRSKDALAPAVLVLLAWPMTAITIFITVKMVGATDQLVSKMISDGDASTFATFFKAAGMAGAAGGAATGGGLGPPIAMMLTMLVVWIFSLILSMVMIFRNLALIVLIAFAPVALMLLPAEVTRAWAKVWVQTVVALILTKPLAAGIVVLALELSAGANDATAALTGLVALIVACASPLAAMKLVSFTGVESGHAAGAAASGAVGTVVGYTGKAGKGVVRTGTKVAGAAGGGGAGGGGAGGASQGAAGGKG